MPWTIRTEDGEYCVYNRETGRKVACHPTKQAAEQQMAALYANVPESRGEVSGTNKYAALGSFDRIRIMLGEAISKKYGRYCTIEDCYDDRAIFRCSTMGEDMGMSNMPGYAPSTLPVNPVGDTYSIPYTLSDDQTELTLGEAEAVVLIYGDLPQSGMKAEWTTAFINGLPDSSFALVMPGGEKDSEGKTTPRSLRYLPYKDAQGKVDLPHLRNALARVNQIDVPPDKKAAARAKLVAVAKAEGVGEQPEPTKSQDYTAVKAGSDGEIEGLGIPFGGPFKGKDYDGEYFSTETDFAFNWYETRPIIYHHGLKSTADLNREKVGQQLSLEQKDSGYWVKGKLDLSTETGRTVWGKAKAGKLFWSSGSLPHLCRKTNDGMITRWPVVEFSLTETPANPYAVAAPAFKSLNLIDPTEVVESYRGKLAAKVGAVLSRRNKKRIEDALSMLQEMLAEIDAMSANDAASKAEKIYREATDMDRDELMALLDEREKSKVDAETQRAQEEERFAAAVKAEVEKVIEEKTTAIKSQLEKDFEEKFAAKNRGEVALFQGANFGSIHDVQSKYDGLEPIDLAFMASVLKSAKETPQFTSAKGPSEELLKACAIKSIDAVEKGKISQVHISGLKALGMKAATDPMYSTLASAGDEWVPDLFNSQLWERIRLEAMVASQFQWITMPSNPYELPIEGADPTWYKVGETAAAANLLLNALNVTASQAGTGKRTLTAAKVGALVWFSGEFEEDSIIPVAAQLRRQMELSGQHNLDYLVLNGDVEAGAVNNINLVDAQPPATSRYLSFDGLRKLALVTTTANSASVGTLTSSSFRNLLALMGTNGIYGASRQNTVFVIDTGTYYKTLALAEAMAGAGEGGFATFVEGDIMKVWGRSLLTSEDIALANTAGKVSNTPGNNVTGTIVAFNKTRWLGGYRRELRIEIFPVPGADTRGIVAYVRPAFINFDVESSAVGYNVSL